MSPNIEKDREGIIKRIPDDLGNTIPDFSYCGYENSLKPIPQISIKAFVKHIQGDATKTIQSAIDYLSTIKPDKNGFRGAILLDKGIFKVAGTIQINANGIVLRGSGVKETLLIGTGFKRKPVISILGEENRVFKDTLEVANNYIPLGSRTIVLENTSELKKGDHVLINTPITQRWIDTLQMNEFGGDTGWIGWKYDDFVIRADREIVQIDGNKITIDAPITNTLDSKISTTTIIPYSWNQRVKNAGIENLTLQSEYNHENIKDEQHRWHGIIMQNTENTWVRQVNFKNFAGGAITIFNRSKKVTVEDCIATNPISEIAEFRRNTFYTEGQQTLFQRCYSEYGYHDFAVGGYATSGPNVFLQCESFMPYSYSGSIGSWATGILFDIVTIDGHALSFKNFGQDSRGLGWNAANSVIWESSASKIENYNPTIANNWAFGVWGQFAGNGHWENVNSHINPRSLFYSLLEQRTKEKLIHPQILNLGSEPSTSPSIKQAAILTKEAYKEKIGLKQWIENSTSRNSIKTTFSKVKQIKEVKTEKSSLTSKIDDNVNINNGRIVSNKGLVIGKSTDVTWWRGSLRESDVKTAKPHITRFVPGHFGLGYTDNLDETVNYMEASNIASIDHNYGLWYERRMDDHERVRRIDANVWAPFYEQPFNRSGKGIAWDQLSKYDLTNYNPWYWDRLHSFAKIAIAKDKILKHELYFQHNILEAGAHWSSSPWRPANNINNMGLPEPPPYAGDKRIFLAEQFYDVSHQGRKALHKAFIEKSLETFKDNSNVLQLTSQEYTGPLHFIQFWLTIVADFEQKNQNKAMITLSATKDVQDAILLDGTHNSTVDVIDIKYWHYGKNGTLYAPEGGKNLSPRQHSRKTRGVKETEESVYKAVQEYRTRFSNKAVIYSTPRANSFGWSVLMAGGSLPAIPKIGITDFNKDLSQMKVKEGEKFDDAVWALENKGESYLFYIRNSNKIEIDLSAYKGKYEVFWIHPDTGSILSKTMIQGKSKQTLSNPKLKRIVAYIKKK